MSKHLTVLGLDPGVRNFAFAVTKFKSDLSQFKPITAGKVQNKVTDLTNLTEQIPAYLDEMLKYLETYRPNYIVVERFMNRGTFSGDQGEYVSGMLMLLVQAVSTSPYPCPVFLVNPGVWKTAFNRMKGDPAKRVKGVRTTLEKMADYCLSEPHELDAYMLTHYGANRFTDTKPFCHLTGCSGKSFITDFEPVTTGKKKRKRK